MVRETRRPHLAGPDPAEPIIPTDSGEVVRASLQRPLEGLVLSVSTRSVNRVDTFWARR